MGKVTLIGAGPGDASLITVRGLEKLKHCDVVIYDRLASEELLDVVREDCILVYVGKKPGAHSMRQEEINRVLVDYGRKYDDVVRLKGGDPFVFGRGGEEILALAEAGIAYEVIPGITSAIAVPELAGIPVTHRGIARSFHVITGHTAEEGVTDDYESLAKLSGTLVFLMGLSNLEKITSELLRCGKSPGTPAAVIAEGATPYERIVHGMLSHIAERVRAAGLSSPVIILIGEVAAFDLRSKPEITGKGDGTAGDAAEAEPADEAKMAVEAASSGEAESVEAASAEAAEAVGAAQKAERYGVIATPRTLAAFRGRMEEAGKKIVPLVTMQTRRLAAYDMLKEKLAKLCDYDWVLFTSKQAVELFFEAVRGCGTDIRALAGIRFAVIGRGTKDALKEHGIFADFLPTHADTETFAREFAEELLGETAEKKGQESAVCADAEGHMRILFPHARQANPMTAELLREAGADVTELSVYDVEGKRCSDLSRLFELSDFVFFSASGVRAFFDEIKNGGHVIPEDCHFWCIGNPTREALVRELAVMRGCGADLAETEWDHAVYVAREASVDGLAKRILRGINETVDIGKQ